MVHLALLLSSWRVRAGFSHSARAGQKMGQITPVGCHPLESTEKTGGE